MNGFLTTHTKGASVSISHHRELFQELLSTILCLPPYVVNVWMWMWIQASLRVYLDCSSFPCPSDCLIDCLLHAPLRSLIWPFFFPTVIPVHHPLLPFDLKKAHDTHPSVQFSSVAQSCLTLCDPMNCSTPGLPVHHQLLEFTQTHVHGFGDAIQPSHPLSSPSPPAPNPSQHQGLFQWVNPSHEVTKVLEFQLQHQSFQWTPRTKTSAVCHTGPDPVSWALNWLLEEVGIEFGLPVMNHQKHLPFLGNLWRNLGQEALIFAWSTHGRLF